MNATDLISQVIDNFEVQEVIGEGGMGYVYRAYHPDLEKYAAIKLMRPDVVRQPGSFERFLQEARTAARLEHPNIVRVLNFGRHEETFYLMMDYIEGPSLRELIADSEKGLSLADIAHIFRQIAEVLQSAHEAGVLHRDLKPDNIIVTISDDAELPYRAMVTDFGLVKIANNSLTHTQQGVSIGTPAYMSPEQCRGEAVDGRTDVYALGVMLYEAITGKRPYPIRNLFDAVKFHSGGNFVPPRAHVPDLPLAMNVLVTRMLSPDVANRPADGYEIAEKLTQFIPSQKLNNASSQVLEKIHTGYLRAAPEGEESGLNPFGRTEQPGKFFISITYQGQMEDVFPPMRPGTRLIVGRQPGSDIQLDKPERYVSKQHCEIIVEEDQVFVRDLNSTNGTYLGKEKIEANVVREWPLSTEINLGSFQLTLQQRAPEATFVATSAKPALTDNSTMIQGQYKLACTNGAPSQLLLGKEPVVIGRLPTSDMVLPNARVSKQHCQVHKDGMSIKVTDLNSTNGTYLQGERLEPHTPVVWTGEPLRVGPCLVTLEL